MSPLLLTKIPLMAMNGPTDPPEMLPKHLYGPIIAAYALIWAHRCCQKNLLMIKKRLTTFSEMLAIRWDEPTAIAQI